MSDAVHMAITRRVRPERVGDFERELVAFVSSSMADSHLRGVHLLYPPPGSGSTEYGILRSFATTADRDAFYASAFYNDWVAKIQPLVDGEANMREVDGLEAWFREPHSGMPPRWKMAILTWVAVWPVSMAVPAILVPIIGTSIPGFLRSGIIAGGIVIVLTWLAMPLLVKLARPWIHPSSKS